MVGHWPFFGKWKITIPWKVYNTQEMVFHYHQWIYFCFWVNVILKFRHDYLISNSSVVHEFYLYHWWKSISFIKCWKFQIVLFYIFQIILFVSWTLRLLLPVYPCKPVTFKYLFKVVKSILKVNSSRYTYVCLHYLLMSICKFGHDFATGCSWGFKERLVIVHIITLTFTYMVIWLFLLCNVLIDTNSKQYSLPISS